MKFHENRSIGLKVIALFPIFKMAAAAILDLQEVEYF
jgi:hypothetical protein